MPQGGGSAAAGLVTQSALYQGNGINIANSAVGNLPWDFFSGGSDLLDITIPAAPTVRKAGLFVVSAQVETVNLTANGYFAMFLILDLTGTAAEIDTTTSRGGPPGFGFITGSWAMAAGQVIRLQVENDDGVATRNFNIQNALVSRIGPA